MRRLTLGRRLAGVLRRLRRERAGVSFLEFALILPILLTMGLYGTEVAYMATVDQQVAQIATSLADNASRLGQTDNSAVTPTVTEAQVDSVMTGALTSGEAIDFAANGRIILSSLERDSTSGAQYIHWQRCRGSLRRDSSYGAAGTGKNGTSLAGMGKAGRVITATTNSAVMFVEVTYQHHPLFGAMFVDNPRFHHEAAYIIRDDRNLTPGVTGTGGQSSCT